MKMESKLKIAITDDHKMFAESLADILQKQFNFEVVWVCYSGQALFERLNSTLPKPDVLLLDVNMKPMDGFDVLAILKKEFTSIKVLSVTMDNRPETIEKLLTIGSDGVVLKDEDTGMLAQAITQLHEKGYYASDRTARALFGMVRKYKKNQEEKLDLSPREMEFLKLCCHSKEYTYKEIADIMGVSQRTVDGYRDSLFEKLDVKSRVGLVRFALLNKI